jgi:hypothetical protein
MFMHLPKTGGTSLRVALCDVYPAEQTVFIYGPGDLPHSMTRPEFAALAPEARDDVRLLMGHFWWGIHRFMGDDARYVTMLRDPVERVVSLYYHFRNLPGLRFGGRGHRERWRMRLTRESLTDWVFSGRRKDVDNLMVRNICGRGDIDFGRCTDDMLTEALEHIEQRFAAVLVTEEMGRSTSSLEALIGHPLPPVGQQNANPRRPTLDTIDPAVLDRIRELNHLDVQLHASARERLLALEPALSGGDWPDRPGV